MTHIWTKYIFHGAITAFFLTSALYDAILGEISLFGHIVGVHA